MTRETAQITIVGEARYVDAQNCAAHAKIGVMDGQYFIMLFPVGPRFVPIVKKGLESLDPMERYLVKEHLRELADPPVAEPLVLQICAAENEDPEGWDYRYGYLDRLDPPKRYVVLEPPENSIAEPYEYVTKILTATREKGPKLSLEFVWEGAGAFFDPTMDEEEIDDEDD